MKRFAIALVLLTLTAPMSAAALTSCLERNTDCTLIELLKLDKEAETAGMSKDDRIAILLDIITQLRRIITSFQSTAHSSFCMMIKNDLALGSTDAKTNGDVSTLQQFLTNERFLETGYITGFYGPRTTTAAYAWQQSQGIKSATGKGGLSKEGRERIRLATCPALDS